MPEKLPTSSLNAKNKPSWPLRLFRRMATRIDPETFSQDANITFDRFGLRKSVGGQFGEISSDSSQFAIQRPSAGSRIDPAKAMENFRGFAYASINAIAREVMNIELRLFNNSGKSPEELTTHEVLDLLDSVNETLTGLELKYLLAAHMYLTGNGYWFLAGVKSDLDPPTAIYPMDPSRVRPVIDRRSWPYQLIGYRMKLENSEMVFKPYEVLHFRLPNPSDPFEGIGPIAAGAEYIDNDNYAQEFNRKFFVNGARPSGFLESEFTVETQLDTLRISFADMHQGIDNMNRIGVLPKGVKWSPVGTNPKDMDFKNLSEDSRDRILAMFGVSRTILGTAESDTNRATAETADYVFSRRVVEPFMKLVCSFLNEKLVPRYGDNLYLAFIDPVPEDRAARMEEMKAALGGQPAMTADEAREEYLGLGPTDGGDQLMRPTTMVSAAEAEPAPSPAPSTQEDDDENASKTIMHKRISFRPTRTHARKRAQQRREMSETLAKNIKEAVKKALEEKPRFSTKEQDDAAWKDFNDRTSKGESEIAKTIKALNTKQQEEVLGNLDSAIEKAIDPTKLFDLDNWISITTDAMSPVIEDLFSTQGKAAAIEIGKPAIEPLSDIAKQMLHDSISKMSKSYNETIRTALEKNINDGLAKGSTLTEIKNSVKDVYASADDYGAERIAKTEAFRTSNMALKEVWKQSGVVKSIRWYTSEKANVCPFCQQMNGTVIDIDDNFFDQGDTLTLDSGDSMPIDYSDVGGPPLHPNCSCFARPEDVSLA